MYTSEHERTTPVSAPEVAKGGGKLSGFVPIQVNPTKSNQKIDPDGKLARKRMKMAQDITACIPAVPWFNFRA